MSEKMTAPLTLIQAREKLQTIANAPDFRNYGGNDLLLKVYLTGDEVLALLAVPQEPQNNNIKVLKNVLGSLITWMGQSAGEPLGISDINKLLKMLDEVKD